MKSAPLIHCRPLRTELSAKCRALPLASPIVHALLALEGESALGGASYMSCVHRREACARGRALTTARWSTPFLLPASKIPMWYFLSTPSQHALIVIIESRSYIILLTCYILLETIHVVYFIQMKWECLHFD